MPGGNLKRKSNGDRAKTREQGGFRPRCEERFSKQRRRLALARRCCQREEQSGQCVRTSASKCEYYVKGRRRRQKGGILGAGNRHCLAQESIVDDALGARARTKHGPRPAIGSLGLIPRSPMQPYCVLCTRHSPQPRPPSRGICICIVALGLPRLLSNRHQPHRSLDT